MKLRSIRNESDYDAALAEIDRLFDAKPGTLRGDRLGDLLALVKVYEDEHWRIAGIRGKTPSLLPNTCFWSERDEAGLGGNRWDGAT